MNSRWIEVIVAPSGEAVVQTRGYAGADCLAASQFLEQALGTITCERKTPEFFLPVQAEQHVRQ